MKKPVRTTTPTTLDPARLARIRGGFGSPIGSAIANAAMVSDGVGTTPSDAAPGG